VIKIFAIAIIVDIISFPTKNLWSVDCPTALI